MLPSRRPSPRRQGCGTLCGKLCGAQEDTFNKVTVAGAGHGRVREVQSRKAYLVA